MGPHPHLTHPRRPGHLAVLAAVVAGACFPLPEVLPAARAACGAACARLEALQCDGWRGSPGPDETWYTADDTSCADVCAAVMGEAPGPLPTECTARAASCEAVEACLDRPEEETR